MTKEIELLAPGGDVDCIKAAILAGADAVYCGLDKFNARNRAANISLTDLHGILRLAHSHHCEVFLTLNIIIVESEIPAFVRLLNVLVNTKIDGVIVQDFGMLYLLSNYFPTLNIHASTQLTTHNSGQIKFLKKLSAQRVNLSRELSLPEIKDLTDVAHAQGVLTEVFVHGSNCLSFSGLCYMSSVHGGNSGNRGRCSQPCRAQYQETEQAHLYPLNLKDNSAYFDLPELLAAQIDSIKIEGRIKKFHYVYTVVDSFRKQLVALSEGGAEVLSNAELYQVFNRGFTNSFLQGDINKNMFIDNPRDNSALHRARLKGGVTPENMDQAKRELYDLKTDIIQNVGAEIASLSIDKAPLVLFVSGASGESLNIKVETPETSFTLSSEGTLVVKNKDSHVNPLSVEVFSQNFKSINDTEFYIERFNLDHLQDDLFITFKELRLLKAKILFVLNGSKELVAPVELPLLPKNTPVTADPKLSILISSKDDVHLCRETSCDVHFELPNDFRNREAELLDLFQQNENLIPWFPAVLIGDSYHEAVDFLRQLQPAKIVTNNTGIAHVACDEGIPWIAGPFLNLVNSYSLICLQETFNCVGAFISSELSRLQIKKLKRPAGFDLYYSMSHPLVLMTSRQCLFHQVGGCKKDQVDEVCIAECAKSEQIVNLKDVSFCLEKSKGNYHTIYNEQDFLNLEIARDFPTLFSSFLIDLRAIKTGTKKQLDSLGLIGLFTDYLAGDDGGADLIKQNIYSSVNSQYAKGI